MCGRFARYSLSRELERYFNANPVSLDLLTSYNVAPTQEIPVIIQQEDSRHFKKLHWGLVPFWAKDILIGSRMINARVESLNKSCTIITTDASDSVKDVHNRMPLILKPDTYDEWLDPGNKEPAKIEELRRKEGSRK